VKKLLLMVAGLVLIAAPLYWLQREPRKPTAEPVPTLSRYLKAAYARDFKRAYRFISSKDKKLKPEKIYSSEQGAFTGFALEVARKLADFITVRPTQLQLEGDRAQVKVALKLPDASSLSPLLLEWDEDRLNALSPAERQKLRASIDKLQRGGKMKMIEGEEEFVLVKEGDAWKLFLDWGKGLRVTFGATVPVTGQLEATPATPETVVRAGELFNVTYRVKNRSPKIISTRISHKVEPHELQSYLDIVQCALLLPVKLLPGKETEYSTTYAVRPDIPANAREINITYEFKLQP
jgi:hypothetical protein